MVIKTIESCQWKELLHSLKHLTSETQVVLWSFAHLKSEFTVTDNDLLLQDVRLVIPRLLWDHTIDLVHEGHQGLVTTKSLLRENVWFPGIDRLTETRIKSCRLWQAAILENHTPPLHESPLTMSPCMEVSADFCNLPNGKHLLVVIDDRSHYPAVEVVSITSAKLDKTV